MNSSFNKSKIIELLNGGVIGVKFIKADGSERLLKCTLQEGLVPADLDKASDTNSKERKPNEEVVAAWDVENSGWRSFRLDRVVEIYK
ncbi:WYL domain containing protein [uncultured Caudovirales phage]|uniref:WYL domain containing protein n=1 Tax=uncultured Caudovirales phage TaxID=2100421 RepID=A0A6J7WT82_9CAUD|nr:WYL domain containing protein [uncultured Caudovirales phage]